MSNRLYFFFLFILLNCFFALSSFAQTSDEIRRTTLGQKIKSSSNYFLNTNKNYSEDGEEKEARKYQKYRGKIIRSIQLYQLDFDLGFENASKIIEENSGIIIDGTKLLDKLHKKTLPETIERNLYIKVNDHLNAYLIADNERYLRTISYIQDAEIKVIPTQHADSVDVIVLTKDLFGYSVLFDGVTTSRQKLGASNINIAGTGQEIDINFLNDKLRSPHFSLEGLYKYQNIKGTFIDFDLFLSNISPNLYDQNEDQFSFLMSFQRPLISQYKRWAGGISLGREHSKNLYPDSYKVGSYQYSAGIFDLWSGYNIGAKKKLRHKNLKTKKFVAIRYFNTVFFDAPAQIGNEKYDQRFNSNKGILGSFTLFRQLFFKDKYIFGFGVTEDLPVGYNANFTIGYHQQLDLKRPYLGFNYYNYFQTQGNDFGEVFFRSGLFINDGRIEDLGILAGSSLYLDLKEYRNIKIRNYFRLSYATLLNRKAMEPLRINNTFGLYGFASAYAKGQQRISLRTENYYFLPFKVLGFNLAPISIADISWLNDYATPFNEAGFFFALGAGLRIKNENLGFNTVEIRASFLPRKLAGDSYFNFIFSTNLDFKNKGNYVNKPALLELNSDVDNHIF